VGNKNKAEQEAARRERESASAAQQALLAQINTPDPLTQKYRDMMSKRLDFFNQGAPNYDLSQTDKEGKPLFPGGPVFADAATSAARAKRASERTGLGAIQMGSYGANPGMMAQLKEQGVRQSAEDASLRAADAVNTARAETFGSVLPLSADQNQRYSIAAGATSNWRNAAEQRWQNRERGVPWWQVLSGIGGQGLAAYMGAGNGNI
jgi:hypothetical protein